MSTTDFFLYLWVCSSKVFTCILVTCSREKNMKICDHVWFVHNKSFKMIAIWSSFHFHGFMLLLYILFTYYVILFYKLPKKRRCRTESFLQPFLFLCSSTISSSKRLKERPWLINFLKVKKMHFAKINFSESVVWSYFLGDFISLMDRFKIFAKKNFRLSTGTVSNFYFIKRYRIQFPFSFSKS